MPEILLVGTANMCRSAYAEILLTHLLNGTDGGEWLVRSAGTDAAPGQPICPEASSRLFDAGVPAGSLPHSARLLDAGKIDRADLVLTATAEQRAAVALLQPRAATRTFTLLEAVRLSRLVPVHTWGAPRLSDLVEDLQASRPLAAGAPRRGAKHWRRRSPATIDIPAGHGRGEHRASLQPVHQSVAQIADMLRPTA